MERQYDSNELRINELERMVDQLTDQLHRTSSGKRWVRCTAAVSWD